ncbi:MAG: toxin-antitoxin system HicB family antitoxin [Peptostreptococcaceae bacterium]|nr:toxin-antitoxin system HicB family antitoxin [Peptostreptococcaceae bacterium]
MSVRIDEDLHKRIKYHLIDQGKSFNEYVIELIKKDLDKSDSKNDKNKKK